MAFYEPNVSSGLFYPENDTTPKRKTISGGFVSYPAPVKSSVFHKTDYFDSGVGDAAYVEIAGDVMSGSLGIATLDPLTVVVTDAGRTLISSAVSNTELGYVSGATSGIQTQLNSLKTAPTINTSLTVSDVTAPDLAHMQLLPFNNENYIRSWNGVASNAHLHFQGDGGAILATLSSDGKFGVGGGFSLPTEKLHIVGNATVTGTIENDSITALRAVATDASNKLVHTATTFTELGYVSGVTSSIQTQLDDKPSENNPVIFNTLTLMDNVPEGTAMLRLVAFDNEAYIQGAITDVSGSVAPILFTGYGGSPGHMYINTAGNVGIGTNFYAPTEKLHVTGNAIVTGTFKNDSITASRAVATDASNKLVHSVTTSTELGYVSGASSSIQTQLDGKGFLHINSIVRVTMSPVNIEPLNGHSLVHIHRVDSNAICSVAGAVISICRYDFAGASVPLVLVLTNTFTDPNLVITATGTGFEYSRTIGSDYDVRITITNVGRNST